MLFATLMAVGLGVGSSIVPLAPECPLIIDVRGAASFEADSISCGHNIPLDVLQASDTLVKQLTGDSTTHKIITYCNQGIAAGWGKSLLEGHGFENIENGGGIVDNRLLLEAECAKCSPQLEEPTTVVPATTTAAVKTTAAAPTTTTKPVATTTKPPPTTTKPVATTTKPPSTTTKPVVTTTKPVATTTKPPPTTTKPVATTTKPPPTTTKQTVVERVKEIAKGVVDGLEQFEQFEQRVEDTVEELVAIAEEVKEIGELAGERKAQAVANAQPGQPPSSSSSSSSGGGRSTGTTAVAAAVPIGVLVVVAAVVMAVKATTSSRGGAGAHAELRAAENHIYEDSVPVTVSEFANPLAGTQTLGAVEI